MASNPSALPQVTVNFSLQIGPGKLDVSADVPREQVNLVQLLPSLKQISDNIMGAVSSAVRNEGFVISCRAGCAACCRHLVPLSLFEAEELQNWIESLSVDQQALLERRFDATLAKLRDAGLLELLSSQGMHTETEEFAERYVEKSIPCPFLQNEACSIYPFRPLVCREFLVTSDPEFCSHPTRETVRSIPNPVPILDALNHLGGERTAEGRGWIPLPFLFAWMRAGISVAHLHEESGPDLLRLVIETAVKCRSAAGAAD